MKVLRFMKRPRHGLYLLILCLSSCIFARHVPNLNQPDLEDLETSAAEPRPAIIDNPNSGPSLSYALPLVSSTSDDDDIHISVASEHVEKTLAPVRRFSYNNNYSPEEKPYETDQELEASENSEGDTQAESSDHKEKGHEHGGKFEKGGGKEFNSDHKSEHGEKGKKGYDGHHHHEKSEKGHHTKDKHHKEFDEEGGNKKHYHHDDGYSGEHHKEEKGEKGSKYDEHGDHKKGHSTKGSHYIHKKDEYDKKTEFFDEDDDSSEFEKHGGFSHKDGYKKGGHHKGHHNKGGSHKAHHGKHAESEKGGHHKEHKGHKHDGGHEEHHQHDEKHGKKEGHGSGKKWSYAKGDGGGGGGHGGKGSHSHVSIAVQKLPDDQKLVTSASKNREEEIEKETDDKHKTILEEQKEHSDIIEAISFKNGKEVEEEDSDQKESKQLIFEEEAFDIDPVETATNDRNIIRKNVLHNSNRKIVPIEVYTEKIDESVRREIPFPAPFTISKVENDFQYEEKAEESQSPKPKKKKLKKRKKATSEKLRKHATCPKKHENLDAQESKQFVIVAADEHEDKNKSVEDR